MDLKPTERLFLKHRDQEKLWGAFTNSWSLRSPTQFLFEATVSAKFLVWVLLLMLFFEIERVADSTAFILEA